MTKHEIELERFQNTRRRRRAQILELVAGIAIMVWVVANFGITT